MITVSLFVCEQSDILNPQSTMYSTCGDTAGSESISSNCKDHVGIKLKTKNLFIN